MRRIQAAVQYFDIRMIHRKFQACRHHLRSDLEHHIDTVMDYIIQHRFNIVLIHIVYADGLNLIRESLLQIITPQLMGVDPIRSIRRFRIEKRCLEHLCRRRQKIAQKAFLLLHLLRIHHQSNRLLLRQHHKLIPTFDNVVVQLRVRHLYRCLVTEHIDKRRQRISDLDWELTPTSKLKCFCKMQCKTGKNLSGLIIPDIRITDQLQKLLCHPQLREFDIINSRYPIKLHKLVIETNILIL